MQCRRDTSSWLALSLLTGLIALAMTVTTGPVMAQDPQPCGLAGLGDDPGEDGFQIDGQFFSGEYSEPGKDWAHGASYGGVILDSGAPNPAFLPALHERDAHWTGNLVDPTTFSGQSNKNNDDITEGERPWAWGAGNGPQKNDLTDVYAHATVYDVGGVPEVWLFLGATTRAVNGDSHIDFEWNIAGLDQRVGSKPTKGHIYGLGSDAGRTVDIDFIISVDFVQGGAVPQVTYRRWTETSAGVFEYVAFTPEPGDVYVCTNGTNIPAPPWGAIAPNGDPSTEVTALQFVEMAVNLTAFGVDPAELCSATSTMMYKTRSSQSFTAELKDYALSAFPIVAQPDCSIFGPDGTCDDIFPVELCGVEATIGHIWSYTWTGPEWAGTPFTTYDSCVEVSQPGVYGLTVLDETNGCESDGCEFDLAVVSPPPCVLRDRNVCEGSYVELCGPEGNYLWTWTLPDSSTATTRCIVFDPVALSDTGTYTLLVQNADYPDCQTECDAWLSVGRTPECALDPPMDLPECRTSGNVLCGPDMSIWGAHSILWEIVSAPDGWQLVPPINERCVTYDAGDAGEATFRMTVTTLPGSRNCSGYCEVTFGCEDGDPKSKLSSTKPGANEMDADARVPLAFAVSANTPNPVEGRTSISYAVPEESHVRLVVHNLRGQVVAVLEDGVIGVGNHTKHWHTEGNALVASGVYFYRMEAAGLETGETFSYTGKMIVLR